MSPEVKGSQEKPKKDIKISKTTITNSFAGTEKHREQKTYIQVKRTGTRRSASSSTTTAAHRGRSTSSSEPKPTLTGNG